jgi:hypothetical protein
VTACAACAHHHLHLHHLQLMRFVLTLAPMLRLARSGFSSMVIALLLDFKLLHASCVLLVTKLCECFHLIGVLSSSRLA